MSSTQPEEAKVSISLRDHAFNLAMAVSAARHVPRLPRVMLDDLLPGVGTIPITIQHEMRERALPHGEALVLSLLVAYFKPRRIFEIGTASGAGTLLMARQAPQALIDTLDLGAAAPALGTQPGEPPITDLGRIGVAWRGTEHGSRITQHFGDSATFDYGPFAGVEDLVFIDGAHHYPYVLSDSRAALSMLSPTGVIVWDDCNYVCPGVSKALFELRAEGREISRIYGTRFAILHPRSPAPAKTS